AIDAAALGTAANEAGHAGGASAAGAVRFDRAGTGSNTILLASFADVPAAASRGAEQPHEPPAVTEERRAVERSAPAQEISQPETPARRHPLRFVWQMDAGNRFSLSAGEFTDLIGPGIAATLNKPWDEITTSLGIDPNGEVTRAIASRDTWSGIRVEWPVEGTRERIAVELSGLPIYDRDRIFRGYRGFGVCRDIARIDEVLKHRAETPAGTPDAAKPPAPEKIAPSVVTVRAGENVLPFRGMTGDDNSTLSPSERNAFSELAQQLSARLRNADEHLRSGRPIEPQAIDPNAAPAPVAAPAAQDDVRPLLNGMPFGILVHRHGQFLYANKSFLAWTGHETLTDFEQAGGLDSLFLEGGKHDGDGQSLMIETPHGDRKPTHARLFTVPWDGMTAMALVL